MLGCLWRMAMTINDVKLFCSVNRSALLLITILPTLMGMGPPLPPGSQQITTEVWGCGTITPGTTTVADLATPTFSINPSPGMRIKEVWLDHADPNAQLLGAVSSYTFDPVTAPHTLSASFELANRKTYAVVSPERDHSELGESWSRPLVLNITHSGQKKWVAVYGAGFNNAVNPAYGAGLYVLDLANGGEVLEFIPLGSGSYPNSYEHSAPASILAITPDSTSEATYHGAMVYIVDLEGRLWKINMTDQGTLFAKTILYNAAATDANERLSFNALTAAFSGGECNNLWLYFGTGDIRSTEIENATGDIANRVFGIKDPDFPDFNASASLYESDLSSSADACPSTCVDTYKGWYHQLDADEKVTGNIALKGGWLLFSHYRPDSLNACSMGTGYLTMMNFVCPVGSGSGDQRVTGEIGKGVPSAPVCQGDRCYLFVAQPESNPAPEFADPDAHPDGIFSFQAPDDLVEADDLNTWHQEF